MENKAHSSKTYAVEGTVSRMQQDLDEVLSGRQFRDDPTRSRLNETRRLHVGIIGAGLAGLKCAETLNRHGVQTTVVEARDQLGGRAIPTTLDGRLIDPGPNWVHGTLTNPIVKLAKETDTDLVALNDEPNMFDEDGKAIEADVVEKLSSLIWEIISEAFRLSNAECATLDPRLSLKDFFTMQLKERGLDEKSRKLLMQMAEMWGSFIGDPWEKQSLKYYWLEECLDGDNLYAPTTHKRIIDSVAAPVKVHSDIHFSTAAERVEYQIDDKVKVHTSEGVFDFDELVVTVPLGCLKRNQPHFDPLLPARLGDAIRQTTFSTLEKVYVVFPAPFWDSRAPSAEYEKGDRQDYPSFTHFICPKYSAANPDAWTLEMQSLSSPAIYGDAAQPTLLFSIYGPCAEHITDLVKDFDRNDTEYHSRLDTFFKPYYALLPNFDPQSATCQPTVYIATDWRNDPWCRGSYTNFQRCEEEEIVGLDDALCVMRRGLPESGVWLAGEHCAPHVATGTLTGAYWSGEIVAKRILKAYGKIDDDAWSTEAS